MLTVCNTRQLFLYSPLFFHLELKVAKRKELTGYFALKTVKASKIFYTSTHSLQSHLPHPTPFPSLLNLDILVLELSSSTPFRTSSLTIQQMAIEDVPKVSAITRVIQSTLVIADSFGTSFCVRSSESP